MQSKSRSASVCILMRGILNAYLILKENVGCEPPTSLTERGVFVCPRESSCFGLITIVIPHLSSHAYQIIYINDDEKILTTGSNPGLHSVKNTRCRSRGLEICSL